MGLATSAAIATAVIAAGALGHSIESSNQAKRIAGQKKNEAVAAGAQAEKELKDQEMREELIQQRDLARINQRRRAVPAGSGLPLPNSTIAPQDPLAAGTGTLIGG